MAAGAGEVAAPEGAGHVACGDGVGVGGGVNGLEGVEGGHFSGCGWKEVEGNDGYERRGPLLSLEGVW